MEAIEALVMKKVRRLDKLVDELANGKPIEEGKEMSEMFSS